MDRRSTGMAAVASRFCHKAVQAAVGACLVVLGAGAIPVAFTGSAEAKTPGKTYCFYRKCHRVKTLEETRRAVGVQQVVIASHYDDPSRDRYNPSNLTSSGEWFRSDRPDNAASPIWPNGTKLLLWNPANKQTAVVRINNAGPYWGNRTLDVSRATAEKLGFEKQGVARLVTKIIQAPTIEEATYKRGRTYEPVPGYVGVFESIDIALLGVTRSITRSLMGEAVLAAAGREPPSRRTQPTLVAAAEKRMTRRERLIAARQKDRPAPTPAASAVASASQQTSGDPITNTIIAATAGLQLALTAPAALLGVGPASPQSGRAPSATKSAPSVAAARRAVRIARAERTQAARAARLAQREAARASKAAVGTSAARRAVASASGSVRSARPATRSARVAANRTRTAERTTRRVRTASAVTVVGDAYRQESRSRQTYENGERTTSSTRRQGARADRAAGGAQPRGPVTGGSRFVAVRCLEWPRNCDFPSAIRERERAEAATSERRLASSRRFSSSARRR